MVGKQERVNPVILNMLSAYPFKTPDDQKKALLEVFQEIILYGLSQTACIFTRKRSIQTSLCN